MSQQNFGLQTVLWSYRTALIGKDLARMNATVMRPGIYAGLVATQASTSTVAVTSGEALVEDSSSIDGEPRIVKVSFASDFVSSATYPNKFIVVRYTWEDVANTYADILNVATVGPHDVVLAVVDYSYDGVSWSIASVDASSSTRGLNDQIDATFLNLAFSIDFSTSRTLIIRPGHASLGNKIEIFNGGSYTFDLSLNSAGRWDMLGLANGFLSVVKGVEGSSAYPDAGAFVPICYAHIRNGMTNFLGTDLIDVRPFLYFVGPDYVTFSDMSQGYDNQFGTTSPSQITGIDVSVSGGDALIAITPQRDITNLLCYQYQLSPDGMVTWYPSSPNGYDLTQPGALSVAWSPSIEVKNLPNAGDPIVGYTPKVYYVRVRQLTTQNVTGPWSDGVRFSTQPISSADLGKGVVTDVSVSSDSLIAIAVSNFNSRNDRIATVPANPTLTPTDGSTIQFTNNIDGSTNLSFEWQFTGTGNAYDIDGFIVYTHQSSSSASYIIGSDPVSETVSYIAPDRMALIMYGAPKDKYYTFGVQAYRIVDSDINAAGIIKSGVVQPSEVANNPFFPQTSSPFVGDIGSTVTSPAALNILDVTAPDSSSSTLSAVESSDGGITVTWSGFNDTGVGVLGYKIWRQGPSTGQIFLVQETLSNVLNYTDYAIAVGSSYEYSVSAYDRNGNECARLAWTTPVTVTGPSSVPVPEPFSAVGGSGYIELSFPVVANRDFFFYEVDRSIDGGVTYSSSFWTRFSVYRDYGVPSVAPSQIVYRARVMFATAGYGTYTVPHTLTSGSFVPTSDTVPASPLVTATAGQDGTISLSWPSSLGTSAYRIFRLVDVYATWIQIAEVDTTRLSYYDSDLVPGRTYTYAVRAISLQGTPDTSAFSSNTSAATLCVDNISPVIPNLNITPLVGAVRLSWITDLRVGTVYDVYRCVGSWSDTSSVLIERLYAFGSSTLNFTDNIGVTAPANFSYKLRTEDPYGNISGFSPNPVQLTQTVIPEFPSDHDLVLYWPFDDAGLVTSDLVSDLSGHGYIGRIAPSSPSTVWTPGKSGSMLNFNADIYVEAPSGLRPDMTGFTAATYAFWLSTFVTGKTIFQHGTPDTDGVLLTSGSDGSLSITFSNSTGIDGATTHYVINLPSGTLYNSLTEYMLVVDNSTRKVIFYSGGQYGSSYDLPGKIQMPGPLSPFVVGASATHTNLLIGSVDEFRIYGTALLPKNALAFQQYVTSGALGNLVAIGTQKYRSQSAPSLSPVPSSVSHDTTAGSGLMRVQLTWDTYAQGDIPANFFTIFWKSNTSAPGVPTMSDPSVTIPVTQGAYVFDNIPPDRIYSFGIAAGRNTETGVVFGPINYQNSSSSPIWENINTAATPNFTGSVAGIASTVVADVTPPTFDFTAIAAIANLLTTGDPAPGSVYVQWNPASDDISGVEGYEVYRSDTSDFTKAVLKAVVLHDGSSYYKWYDTSVVHETTYYYTVRPFDFNKNKTSLPVSPSPWHSVVAYNALLLQALTSITAAAVEGYFEVTWPEYTGPLFETYLLEKSPDSGTTWTGFSTANHEVASASRHYSDPLSGYPLSTDPEVTNVRYRVRVKLTCGSRTDSFANSATVTSTTVDVSQYPDFRLSQVAVNIPTPSASAVRDFITISWSAYSSVRSQDVAGYYLYESPTGASGTYNVIYTGPALHFQVTIPELLSPGLPYEASDITGSTYGRFYKVQAYSVHNDSSEVPYKSAIGLASSSADCTLYETYYPLVVQVSGGVTFQNSTWASSQMNVQAKAIMAFSNGVVVGQLNVGWSRVTTNLADREVVQYFVEMSPLGNFSDTVTLGYTTGSNWLYTIPSTLEASVLSSYRFRIRPRTSLGVSSVTASITPLYGITSSVDVTSYGTYTAVAPVATAVASKRSITVAWDKQESLINLKGYLIQIDRATGSLWRKPNLGVTADANGTPPPTLWGSGFSTGITVNISASAKTFTRTDTGSFVTDGFIVGDFVNFLGAASQNQHWWQITAVSALVITCGNAAALVNQTGVVGNVDSAMFVGGNSLTIGYLPVTTLVSSTGGYLPQTAGEAYRFTVSRITTQFESSSNSPTTIATCTPYPSATVVPTLYADIAAAQVQAANIALGGVNASNLNVRKHYIV